MSSSPSAMDWTPTAPSKSGASPSRFAANTLFGRNAANVENTDQPSSSRKRKLGYYDDENPPLWFTHPTEAQAAVYRASHVCSRFPLDRDPHFTYVACDTADVSVLARPSEIAQRIAIPPMSYGRPDMHPIAISLFGVANVPMALSRMSS